MTNEQTKKQLQLKSKLSNGFQIVGANDDSAPPNFDFDDYDSEEDSLEEKPMEKLHQFQVRHHNKQTEQQRFSLINNVNVSKIKDGLSPRIRKAANTGMDNRKQFPNQGTNSGKKKPAAIVK